jgi:hypothetical protein
MRPHAGTKAARCRRSHKTDGEETDMAKALIIEEEGAEPQVQDIDAQRI